MPVTQVTDAGVDSWETRFESRTVSRKIISQALLLVVLGWALPPSLLSANVAMSHAVSHTKQAENPRVTQNHACCPHLHASTAPAPINLATPCKSDHHCCFLRGQAL